MTASKTRVAIGAPVDLTYRFELTGAPLAGDFAVFAHFVNADGQVLWNDDHEPSPPTSTWRPGEPVEYTRTIFLPTGVLHPGDVAIEVGLYRDGERLPLESTSDQDEPGARAYRVVDLQLAPESENVFVIYQSGWHQDEFSNGSEPRSWRWTQKSAVVAFRNPRTDVEILMVHNGAPEMFPDAPQQVSVIGADGDVIDTFEIASADPVLRRIHVAAAQLGTADLTELRFDIDRTFTPAERNLGDDSRELGMRVYQLHVGVD